MKKGLYLMLKSKHLVYFSSVFFVLILFSWFLFTGKTVTTGNISTVYPVIIIDAGHGGGDGGTQSASGILEKDINLDISKKLKVILEKSGFRTVMIREDDRMIHDDNCTTVRSKKTSDLHNRLEIMKSYPGCIFLSIHQNHFSESKYSGAQVFYRPGHTESKNLAECIQKSIVSEIQNENTRQIKPCTSDVFLIHNAVSTAVMVECGFLSNEKEAELLNDSKYRERMASAIMHGLTDYLCNKDVNLYGKQN